MLLRHKKFFFTKVIYSISYQSIAVGSCIEMCTKCHFWPLCCHLLQLFYFWLRSPMRATSLSFLAFSAGCRINDGNGGD